jgi:hypothetical protein
MNIWQNREDIPILPIDLTVEARLILGILTTCKNASAPFVSEVLGYEESEVVEMIKDCQESRHPLMTEIFSVGLNPIAAVSLVARTSGQVIRCKQCNRAMQYVPCLACSSEKRFQDSLHDVLAGEEDLPEPAPTPYHPGSDKKKNLMAYRKQNGYSIFSNRDYTPYLAHERSA